MVYGTQIKFNRIINIQIMSSWNWIQIFLITCGNSLGLIWYMPFFPFNSSNICKLSCIHGLLFGSSYKTQMSWKLDVYYLIAIHCKLWKKCSNKWDHMFMFQYSMTRFECVFQKQMLKATYVFIQPHFIDIENRKFVDYISTWKWSKRIPSEICFLECTIYMYKPF
jgi:hypothetical protein